MDTLQKRLRAVRGSLTQSDFASRLQTPLTTLGRYERGTNLPDLDFIINMCTIFDVSPAWLLFGKGSMRGG
ncbi:helix-turn-helix transcriptional regulator, partial [uncultured Bilophila sp.]